MLLSLTLTLYSLRYPNIPRRVQGAWWASQRTRWRTIHHLVRRTEAVLLMASSLDLLGRTAELARVFGIEFNAVLMRGSQYRVESMMMRMARTQNFLLISPSKAEVAEQPAMDSQPLVMEPTSGARRHPFPRLSIKHCC